MRCGWTMKPCDPESYDCHYFHRIFGQTKNKGCEHIISEEEAEDGGD